MDTATQLPPPPPTPTPAGAGTVADCLLIAGRHARAAIASGAELETAALDAMDCQGLLLHTEPGPGPADLVLSLFATRWVTVTASIRPLSPFNTPARSGMALVAAEPSQADLCAVTVPLRATWAETRRDALATLLGLPLLEPAPLPTKGPPSPPTVRTSAEDTDPEGLVVAHEADDTTLERLVHHVGWSSLAEYRVQQRAAAKRHEALPAEFRGPVDEWMGDRAAPLSPSEHSAYVAVLAGQERAAARASRAGAKR